MNSVLAPISASHRRKSLATNSGPLSERMYSKNLSDHRVGHLVDHIPTLQSALPADRQTLPRVFIDQVQHPHPPAIVGKGADEVVRPNMIASLRTQSHARPVVDHNRPRGRFCFCGTRNPSRRQILSTLSLPTCQPARCSSILIGIIQL